MRRHGTLGLHHRVGYVVQVHRRPRYRCQPVSGRIHYFTLGRVLPHEGACERCDRDFNRHDGPVSPRGFMHVVPDIARALTFVGQGLTYRRASIRTRQLTGVVRYDRTRARSFPEYGGHDGTLSMDWVELFTDVCVGPDLLKEWPAGQGILVDAHQFGRGMRKLNPVTGVWKSGYTSWSIIAVMVPLGMKHELRIVKLVAVPGVPRAEDYEAVFRSLPGRPAFFCSDEDAKINAGALAAWPGIRRFLAWDKLELALKGKLIDAKRRDGELWRQIGSWRRSRPRTTKAPRHPRWGPPPPAVTSIFRDPVLWQGFKLLAAEPASPYYEPNFVAPWVKAHDQEIQDQMNWMPYFPSEGTAVESIIAQVSAAIEDHSYSFKNLWRTNLMLKLVTNELAGKASERTYRRRIREALLQSNLIRTRGLIYASPRLRR